MRKRVMGLHMRHRVLLRRERFFPALGKVFFLLVLIVVIITTFVLEVGRPLVFVRLSIILVSPYCFIDISRRELVELLVVAENDHCDVDRT